MGERQVAPTLARTVAGALLFAGALVAGCGGGSDTGLPPDGPMAGTDTTLLAADVAALIGSPDGATFTVTYRIESSAKSSGSERDVSGTWTWAQNGASGQARFETDALEGVEGVLTVFTGPDETVYCMHEACLGVPAGPGPFINPAADLRAQLDQLRRRLVAGPVWDDGVRMIAGVEGRCVAFREEATRVTGSACFGAAGLPIRSEWKGPGGHFLLEATTVEPRFTGLLDPPHPVVAWGE